MTKHLSVGAFHQEFSPGHQLCGPTFHKHWHHRLDCPAMHLRISWVIVEGECLPNQYGQIQQSARPAPIRGRHRVPLRPRVLIEGALSLCLFA